MEFDVLEYKVGGWWLSALFNSDYTGLSEDEAAQLDAWINKQTDGQAHHYSDGESVGFARDDISGLRGECFALQILIPRSAPC